MSNKFDIYSSKVKRINIPIPEFKFCHKPSSEEEVDPKFIGREQITDKLYSWLKDDSTGGSYLVTGFRGMGKSSLVGRVLNQLIRKTSFWGYFWGLLFFFLLPFTINFSIDICNDNSIIDAFISWLKTFDLFKFIYVLITFICILYITFIVCNNKKNSLWEYFWILLFFIQLPISVPFYLNKYKEGRIIDTFINWFQTFNPCKNEFITLICIFYIIFRVWNIKKISFWSSFRRLLFFIQLPISVPFYFNKCKEECIIDTFIGYLQTYYPFLCIIIAIIIAIIAWKNIISNILNNIRFNLILIKEIYFIPEKYKFSYKPLQEGKWYKKLYNKSTRFFQKYKSHVIFYYKVIGKLPKIDWKRCCGVLYSEYIKNRSYKKICLKVNLGQEILNEREVLSLISHQLYTKYREYVLSPIANFFNWFIWIFGISIISYLIRQKVDLPDILFVTYFLILLLVIYVIAYFFSSSQIRIFSRLRLLNQRLDAQVSFGENYGPEVVYDKTSFRGFGFRKERVYDIAKIREIEQELIDVLDSISRGFPFVKHPSVIVVFDELDKVDSNSISGPVADIQAEFTHEKNFPGGGTTRRRKQNVLHLLANMKLFVSTAKAKFIFVSGRELYDAYLADLSDREFAVSSIFSGVIYVDSFCVNEHKGKDVMSNVEKYICKQLIPYDYIEKQFARYYAMELVNGPAFDRFDINLKLYYQYLVDVYNIKFKSKYGGNTFVDPFDDKKTCYEINEINAYLYRSYIDKAVNLLYHFSVYLYHISNGSPKKMMLYFEKYVKKCYDKGREFQELQDEISNPNPDGVINILSKDAPQYYLSFGYTDQRKIGLIHYLSYPVNQILVNANQYSDKLLVSVSFLVDHIYKFHNGGFSWRNLEYTPELLEVYKIPGFRSFINSIISYLQQTHLIAISCGLFQFKFRKKISDEITLASKFSDEIAALFNFTLDESLNVKQHYSEIRNAYLELEGRGDEQTPKHTPRLSIGLHNILGDLYMFDEEFNNAILEYHAAIKELEKEIEEKKGDYPDLRNTLYLIQLLLKLGLANEKRNTNESALTVYSELVAKLIDFRHFDERKLQLTYRLRKHVDWPSYEGVLVPQKYDDWRNVDFNNIHPRIVDDSNKLLEHDDMPFMASGQHLSTAFAHLLTPEKYSVMQRLSLFQDSRLVYQALLAKLFVKEKIGLGGITITDIETIESEYIYLNLATNVSEKFLTSSDFFRRLGDIMFYKNGLTVITPKNKKGLEDKSDSFVDGLYYWGYDIRRELLDFCNLNHCYKYYDVLFNIIKKVKNSQIEKQRYKEKDLDKALLEISKRIIPILKRNDNSFDDSKISIYFDSFFRDKSPHTYFLKLIPRGEVTDCNKHRQLMFKNNRPVPCFACNYYSRSMRILMKGMFGCNILEERKNKNGSVFVILEKLLIKGTSRSLRQDYVIQLAEILDCRANVLLSCATDDDNYISELFMKELLSFLSVIEKVDLTNNSYEELISSFETNVQCAKEISKLEECILYYWESSKCFSIGNDLMKASESLKKVLRIFQNYLKISEDTSRKKMVCDYMEYIKNTFVKPCLVYLYSHYNNINFAEIQKLKWIFSVQTYESISLNRLSLYPDIEQILLLYYDLLRRSHMFANDETKKKNYQQQLSKIYRNTTLGSLRQDSTIYERVMALRFKTLMNNDLLHKIGLKKDIYYCGNHEECFHDFFVNYTNKDNKLSDMLGNYQLCFTFALRLKIKNSDNQNEENAIIEEKLLFLEYLIKDSLFCLTRILEIITPHTSSTLFSNSFYGEIYQMVYEWHMLFDELFLAYTYLDTDVVKRPKSKLLNLEIKNRRNVGGFFRERNESEQGPSYFERFFNENIHEIGKAQANYTFAKYSLAMAYESYESTLQMHHEGKAYKDMISQMYYLDDDLKNDTIQFTLAVERYKINNGFIQKQRDKIKKIRDATSMYDIDLFANDNMNSMNLEGRFY